MSDKLTHWREWLDGDLKQHMFRILFSREVFRSWNDMLDITEHPVSVSWAFHAWVVNNYLTALSVSVRTACDPSSSAKSLLRFLEDVKRNPDVLATPVHRATVKKHIREMTEISEKVKAYVKHRRLLTLDSESV